MSDVCVYSYGVCKSAVLEDVEFLTLKLDALLGDAASCDEPPPSVQKTTPVDLCIEVIFVRSCMLVVGCMDQS